MDDFKRNFKIAPDWLLVTRGQDRKRLRRQARRRLRRVRWNYDDD